MCIWCHWNTHKTDYLADLLVFTCPITGGNFSGQVHLCEYICHGESIFSLYMCRRCYKPRASRKSGSGCFSGFITCLAFFGPVLSFFSGAMKSLMPGGSSLVVGWYQQAAASFRAPR